MSNTKNITVDQGSSYTYIFTLMDVASYPFDLTGYDARLQVRRTYGDTGILLTATVVNGKLVIGTNTVTLNLEPDDTSSIRFTNKDDDILEAVYDLEIVSSAGKVYKPARGLFTLNREITR
jgi:hypothetical protein